MSTRLYWYDTTLRDGAQTQGVSFTPQAKKRTIAALDALGIDYIEAGWPGANPADTVLFAQPPALHHARLTAFDMTHKTPMPANKGVQTVCIVGKTRRSDAEKILGVTADENLQLIAQNIARAVADGKETHFDAEHFFDAIAEDAAYALQCVQVATQAGARFITLCDTNGGTMPLHIARGVEHALQSGAGLGIHCHNDTGLAVASSLAAVDAGATLVQGTINGLGERCGNADLCTLIPIFALKAPYAQRFTSAVGAAQLEQLTAISRLQERLINRAVPQGLPYVGRNAFTHKGGLHVSSVLKDPRTYEHVDPSVVGNARVLPVSDQAGRATVAQALRSAGIDNALLTPEALAQITDILKTKEFAGYVYDSAAASFELLARRHLNILPQYYSVAGYSVTSTCDDNGQSQHQAQVRLRVGEQLLTAQGSGNGPVHALDTALRQQQGPYSQALAGLQLSDFRVCVLSGGTDAITRVLIDFSHVNGQQWTTVGVGGSVLDASFEALLEGLVYALLQQNVAVPAQK